MIPSLRIRKLQNMSPETLSERAKVQIPGIQRDSIATAETIMERVGTERSEKRTVRPGRILRVIETVETVSIPLHPESAGTGFTDSATINHYTVTLYRLHRLASAMRRQDTGAQTPLSTESFWHVRLGLAPRESNKPADMVEEIFRVAPPVIPDRDRAVDLADAKAAASMDSFASFVIQIQAAEALRAAGTIVELPANIAV
jgi:hypothetical protein